MGSCRKARRRDPSASRGDSVASSARRTADGSGSVHSSSPLSPMGTCPQIRWGAASENEEDPSIADLWCASSQVALENEAMSAQLVSPKAYRRLEGSSVGSLLQEVLKYLESAPLLMLQGNRTRSTTCSREDSTESHGNHSSVVMLAVHEALQVLCGCWNYSGEPQDAFEPVRGLPTLAVELLLAFGKHAVTEDGLYVMLRGGREQLPWVARLMVVLEECDRRLGGHTVALPNPSSSPFAHNWNQPRRPSCSSDSTAVTGRLLMLNCHGFGWLDSIGGEDYEVNQRYVCQVNAALKDQCSLAPTSVLLSDVMIVGGGLTSFHIASKSSVFSAHQEFGRGLAVLVPQEVPPSPSFKAPTLNCRTVPRMRPVDCGVRLACGYLIQAVLRSPVGPLILHVQSPSPQSMGSGTVLAAHHDRAQIELAEWVLFLLSAGLPSIVVEWAAQEGLTHATTSSVEVSTIIGLLNRYLETSVAGTSASMAERGGCWTSFAHLDLPPDIVHGIIRRLRPLEQLPRRFLAQSCAPGTREPLVLVTDGVHIGYGGEMRLQSGGTIVGLEYAFSPA